ncbi:MAG: hypothetical protein HUJ52_01020 [Malacoplasma sp.]|nr:hypothetical protein [Malacoplasma sp.]
MSWLQNRKKQIQVESSQTLTQAQGSILGKSFGWATLGFFVLAVLTLGLMCIWQFLLFPAGTTWSWETFQGLNLGLTIAALVLTITSAILSMFWQTKMLTMQNATVYTWLVWSFFIVGQSFAFSWLTFMLNNTISVDSAGNALNLWWVCPAAFGLGFVLFGIFALIGYNLGIKGQITVNKMIMVCSIIMAAMLLPLLIFMFLCIWMPWGVGPLFWITFLLMALYIFILFLSIISIIGDIKRSDEFARLNASADQHGEIVKRLSLVYGFSLLVEFICLVWMLIWFIISVLGVSRRA